MHWIICRLTQVQYNKIVLWKQMWMEVWKVSGEGGGSGGWLRGGKRKVGKEKKQDKYLNE